MVTIANSFVPYVMGWILLQRIILLFDNGINPNEMFHI